MICLSDDVDVILQQTQLYSTTPLVVKVQKHYFPFESWYADPSISPASPFSSNAGEFYFHLQRLVAVLTLYSYSFSLMQIFHCP